MIKVGVIGATGYAGNELVRILMQHPEVEITTLTANSHVGKTFDEVYENYREINETLLIETNIEKMANECDVIFMALGHGIASETITEEILEKCVVIDLGADFRLTNTDIYEKWYKVEHKGKKLLKEAIYGLCEINRDKIKTKKLIANPGCYTTCSILSLMPLVKEGVIEPDSIVIDAKSGVSGAGRSVGIGTMFCETNENIKAYGVASHRHTPEIEEQLSIGANEEIVLTFTPHLTPMNRGILATCYGKLKKSMTYEDIKSIYEKYYKEEHFIRLTKKGVFPETKWVKGSNFVDIGFTVDERTNRIIVVGAIDNLGKGAASQAIQNMNIVFGLDERTGLNFAPIFPV